MSFLESIKKRGLNPENVFISSFFAGLNEFGILNQGVVYLAGKRVGTYLATYCKEKGNFEATASDDKLEQSGRSLAHLNAELNITLDPADLYVEKEDLYFLVKIKASQCRFCPKGVGEAELKGTLCPFPGLIEEFLHSMTGRKFTLEKMDNQKLLVKDGDWCKIRFS